MPGKYICVCICTFKRPRQLKKLIQRVLQQETGNLFGYSIVIVDNDKESSAESVVAAFTGEAAVDIRYSMEPVPNIARARNRAVSIATGDYLAFIDDDEMPARDWLMKMFSLCEKSQVAGALGPVLPYFESEAPLWLVKAGFYDRPRHVTGFEMKWEGSRCGNVMVRRGVVEELLQPFRDEFGSGGEDQDFFRRLMDLGHKFIWCDDAPVFETIPPHRWRLTFLLRRALLRGGICLKHPRNRAKNIGKSIVALPAYGVALPFLLLGGRYLFAKYLVKMFDHAGRLLALFRLNPTIVRNN
ncbi:MAG: glycosyltransferase family A protein [Chloroflexia bacterium]